MVVPFICFINYAKWFPFTPKAHNGVSKFFQINQKYLVFVEAYSKLLLSYITTYYMPLNIMIYIISFILISAVLLWLGFRFYFCFYTLEQMELLTDKKKDTQKNTGFQKHRLWVIWKLSVRCDSKPSLLYLKMLFNASL